MFEIAICDNEKYFRQELKQMLAKDMMDRGLVFQIDSFASGEEFTALGIGIVKYTIIFLDIHLENMDGFMTAKKIRAVSKEVFIVFVTEYEDYALQGYKVDAIRYLLKGDLELKSEIHECLDAIIEKMNYKIVKKKFKFNEEEKEISLDRLLYIESKLHKLEFHIMEQDMKIYTMYEKLNKMEQKLEGYGFIRIHQSFLANLKYIKEVKRYKVILNNGIELRIPKARYKQVKDLFMAYQREI